MRRSLTIVDADDAGAEGDGELAGASPGRHGHDQSDRWMSDASRRPGRGRSGGESPVLDLSSAPTTKSEASSTRAAQSRSQSNSQRKGAGKTGSKGPPRDYRGRIIEEPTRRAEYDNNEDDDLENVVQQ